jgi:hypothetical protein
MFNIKEKIYKSLTSKEGNEIAQTLIIISIVGAVGIAMTALFRNELNNSLVGKVNDETTGYLYSKQSIDDYTEVIGVSKGQIRYR